MKTVYDLLIWSRIARVGTHRNWLDLGKDYWYHGNSTGDIWIVKTDRSDGLRLYDMEAEKGLFMVERVSNGVSTGNQLYRDIFEISKNIKIASIHPTIGKLFATM